MEDEECPEVVLVEDVAVVLPHPPSTAANDVANRMLLAETLKIRKVSTPYSCNANNTQVNIALHILAVNIIIAAFEPKACKDGVVNRDCVKVFLIRERCSRPH